MFIANCAVTKSDATIVKYYVDTERSSKYKINGGLCAGVVLKSTSAQDLSAYSLCPGIVVYTGVNNTGAYGCDLGKYVVIVMYNRYNAVMYSGLASLNVKINDKLNKGDKLGSCKSILVSYLSKENALWAVRLDSQTTWYKHDPLDILQSGYETTFMSIEIPEESSEDDPGEGLNPEADYTLSNNQG